MLPTTALPEPQQAARRRRAASWRRRRGGGSGRRRRLLPAGVPTSSGRSSWLRPVTGGEQVARYTVAITERIPALTLVETTVNGRPGLLAHRDGAVVTVIAFDVAGELIRNIWAVRNPGKLRSWVTAVPSATAP
ncbi:hypothetical protein [Amycolatopsis sp. NPDC051128]|uniref:hypothetical protein n=1 Tax=Amycolatopsis sp. NPDC051128 TaxID=3155412 RepID=UPI0034445822